MKITKKQARATHDIAQNICLFSCSCLASRSRARLNNNSRHVTIRADSKARVSASGQKKSVGSYVLKFPFIVATYVVLKPTWVSEKSGKNARDASTLVSL